MLFKWQAEFRPAIIWLASSCAQIKVRGVCWAMNYKMFMFIAK